MEFVGTRGEAAVGFTEAVFRGLAPNGGLYHPTSYPDLSELFASLDPHMPFVDLAATLTAALLGDELGTHTAEAIARKAFLFSPEVVQVEDRIFLNELFHGPSCAFKDFGACFLAAAVESLGPRDGKKTVVLTATSGDTGSAVAQAFAGREAVEVVVLFPRGRVSPLQEKQLTTVGGNVTAVEVDGAFDDCQRLVKAAFASEKVRRQIRLTSANSINLGRLIPQAYYYVDAWLRLRDRPAAAGRPLRFVVPSGNFGNLTAGLLAWKWGLPVAGFVAATNINDVVPSYLETGFFSPKESVRTHSNAMDVGNPSNFERLTALFDGAEAMRKIVSGRVVDDTSTEETIARLLDRHGRFVCPHTAVGLAAAEREIAAERESAVQHGAQDLFVVLATADAGKFREVVAKATGREAPLPERLRRAMDMPGEAVPLEPRTEALEAFLLDRYSS